MLRPSVLFAVTQITKPGLKNDYAIVLSRNHSAHSAPLRNKCDTDYPAPVCFKVFEVLASALNANTTSLEWQAKTESIDQDTLVISAIVLGLAPLLHWRLASSNVSLAPRAMAKLV